MIQMILQSWNSSWYIYLLMIVFFCVGVSCIFRLYKCGKDYQKAIQRLNGDNEYVKQLKDTLNQEAIENEPLFHEKTLNSSFTEYQKERIKSQEIDAASSYINITDYFNVDQLDEIGSTAIADLIPGSMTALGILGTFLGLVFGISGFDTASTETITSSITGLLGGMGTAFLTSIAGVFFSVVFSYAHKIVYRRAEHKMEEFIVLFHDRDLDGYNEKAETQFLGFQKKMTENQKQQISLMEGFAEAVGQSVSRTMKEELTPIFTRMEKTVEEFSEMASAQQKDGLEQVVQEFIRCMNDSLQSQFEELGKTIQELCEWQKNSVTQMQNIVDGICDTSTEIEKINEISRQTIVEMNRFVTMLNDLQANINEELELTRQQIEQGNRINEKQAAYVENLVECENRICDFAKHVQDEADAVQKSVDVISEHCKDQLNGITDAAKENMETLSESTKVLVEGSRQQMQTLAETAANEMQMLSETAASMSEENHNQLSELTEASASQMDQLSNVASAVMENSRQQITEAIRATKEQSDSLMQATNDFAEFVQQEQRTLSEAVNKEISGLAGFAGSTSNQLQAATNGMGNAAKTLDKNLDDVLGRTFDAFDKNLTDITQHLSGTIADVRDTTDSLPGIFAETQDQWKNIMNGLAKESENYITAMRQLTSTVEQKYSEGISKES